jgi:DNA-binding LytR/AlgR family response regulator
MENRLHIIVFTDDSSALCQFESEVAAAFSLDAMPLVHFLHPPLTKENIRDAVSLFSSNTSGLGNAEDAADGFVLKAREGDVRLRFSEILYCESEKRLVFFHLQGATYSTYAKLSDIEKDFPQDFVRCHQSFLVNIRIVRRVGKEEIELTDGCLLPISQRRKKAVSAQMEKMTEFL